MEKNKKRITDIFNSMFWIALIGVVGEIFFKILYLTNLIKFDLTEYTLLNYIIVFVYLGIIFSCVKLSKKGSIYAGILGVVCGIIETLFGGILWKIIGIILVVNSIMYLVNYNKK